MVSAKTLKFCKDICKIYKVKLYVRTLPNVIGGIAYPADGVIELNRNATDNEFKTALFHEVQHCLNFRNGKYKAFHQKRATKKTIKRWALPAEIYTDKMGKKLAAKHGFKQYKINYTNSPHIKKFLNDWIEGLI